MGDPGAGALFSCLMGTLGEMRRRIDAFFYNYPTFTASFYIIDGQITASVRVLFMDNLLTGNPGM